MEWTCWRLNINKWITRSLQQNNHIYCISTRLKVCTFFMVWHFLPTIVGNEWNKILSNKCVHFINRHFFCTTSYRRFTDTVVLCGSIVTISTSSWFRYQYCTPNRIIRPFNNNNLLVVCVIKACAWSFLCSTFNGLQADTWYW